MYDLVITPGAQRRLGRLPWKVQEYILRALKDIKEAPMINKSLGRELTGQKSLRIGIYRIVYKIIVADKKILITRIGHRSKVYN